MTDPTSEEVGGTALSRLREHRWWPYRACAPDPDQPSRAAGDPGVEVTAWLTPDGESQAERHTREETATGLCARCPVRDACLAYALGDTGGPGEAWHVWGGMTAYQRDALLKQRRLEAARDQQPAVPPVSELDLTVLRALAVNHTPKAVARAAGLTVTRANWHRSRLLTALNLSPRTTSRMRLIYRARLVGLLDPTVPYRCDITRVIAALPAYQVSVARHHGIQLMIPELRDFPPAEEQDGDAAPGEETSAGVLQMPTAPTRARHLAAAA